MSNSSHLSRIDDRAIRWMGIPAFGILIPNFTGLFGDYGPDDLWYWAGYVFFIFISWCIWHGNRWMLFRQRENMSWFSSPIRKLIMLVAANVFYTAPLTVVLIIGWYWFSGIGTINWDTVQLVTLANVICVIFVTHAYETVFLIKERQTDLLAFEQLERTKVEAELEMLKSQIDPHFMFNSLNTLSYLIANDQKKALLFNESLSDVYRYILMNKQKKLVTLQDEIVFANSYFTLVKIRFGSGVRFEIDIPKETNKLLAPISLQLLLENAVKHNEFSEKEPLYIHLTLDNGSVRCTNNIRSKQVNGSSKIGLRNLTERYRLLTGKEVVVEHTKADFTVKLPYLEI